VNGGFRCVSRRRFQRVEASELASLSLFGGLPDEDRERLAPLVDELRVDEGVTLTSEGDYAYQLFVIVDGTAEARRDGTLLRELNAGDFFGEIGLLFTGRRTATVVATSPMRLAVVFDRNFRRLEREQPGIAAELRAAVRERLSRGEP
jgi:CRP-like cAMP-binding protein